MVYFHVVQDAYIRAQGGTFLPCNLPEHSRTCRLVLCGKAHVSSGHNLGTAAATK